MINEAELEREIIAECDKLILRYETYHNSLHAELTRVEKRLGTKPKKVVRKPDYWDLDAKFNPFYCKGKARAIARAIAKKIRDRSYAPVRPHEKPLKKLSGGFRTLRIYQIPDAVVSKIIYKRLLTKNRHRFSAFSYAYRDDRSVHYAIQDMHSDISSYGRVYVAEFDFSDFFGNISHEHLRVQLKSNGLMLSDEDHWLIDRFLLENKGIPQGTSVSLFLANVACLALDKSLERIGVKFARYADDTVICSSSYDAICRAVDCIMEFSRKSGVSINMEKSDGIHLLSDVVEKSEIRAKGRIEFLGYSIGSKVLGIKKSSEQRIKKRISYLIYRNLIQPLNGPVLRSIRVPGLRDDDFITAMMQVRRYISGSLSKSALYGYINGVKGKSGLEG